jgi:ribosomal-protein-alanine N-acetyltransferase
MLITKFEPFPDLNTARLTLRAMAEHDVPALFLLRSDPRTMKYIDRKRAENLKEAEDFLKMIRKTIDDGEGLAWAIALKDAPHQLIGNISFWRITKEHFRAEIGYMLLTEYWNMGIMKEAIREVLQFGFSKMKLHSIEARINPQNKASSKVLLSTGFVKQAYFKEDYFFNGIFGDTEVYSKLVTKY